METIKDPWLIWSQRQQETAGGGECMALAGCECRYQGESYDWHGLQRGGDAQRPILLLQHSHSAGGAFCVGSGREQAIPDHHLMVAIIPSNHRYRLAPGHRQWNFTWLILRHPFVVERVARACSGIGMLLDLQQTAYVMDSYEHIWESVLTGRLDNEHDREHALISCALAIARSGESLESSDKQAERLRSFVRQEARRGATTVSELACAAGSSRSAFSHRFSRITGMSPAAYLRQQRLAAVARELRETDIPLRQLAQAHGFADATHLGKAFRQRYHLSPGAWRRLGQ